MRFKYVQVTFVEANDPSEAYAKVQKAKPTQLSLETVENDEVTNQIGFKLKR
jgi:hypothetical protein